MFAVYCKQRAEKAYWLNRVYETKERAQRFVNSCRDAEKNAGFGGAWLYKIVKE